MSDPIEFITLFEYVEEQFRVYGVPHDMKVRLMRPFPNDRASSLLACFDAERACSYQSG